MNKLFLALPLALVAIALVAIVGCSSAQRAPHMHTLKVYTNIPALTMQAITQAVNDLNSAGATAAPSQLLSIELVDTDTQASIHFYPNAQFQAFIGSISGVSEGTQVDGLFADDGQIYVCDWSEIPHTPLQDKWTLSVVTVTTLHEIGHSFGLKHAPDPNAIMYYMAPQQIDLAQVDALANAIEGE